MKKTALLLVTLLPTLAGCVDLTGIGEALGEALAEGWGGGLGVDFGPMGTYIEGPVFIGSDRSIPEEGTARFYLPADTTVEVASAELQGGFYRLWVAEGDTQVCQYLVTVERWDGVRSELVPVFDTPPSPCEPVPAWPSGVAVRLPAYEPLETPFEVEGRVWVDGAPAEAGEATAIVFHREIDGVSETRLEVDGDGWYRLETTDAALRFGFCRFVEAAVSAGVRAEYASVGGLPASACEAGRRLPEVRFGSVRAALGSVAIESGWPDRMVDAVGAGEAVAELLAPGDSTVVGDPAPTLDDGTFQLWFPHDLQDPGCDWRVRVTLSDGRSMTRPLLEPGLPCGPDQYLWFVFADDTPPPASAVLELVVEDPAGDHTGLSDVTRMTMAVDFVTGDWTLVLEADSAAPFQDSLRVNVNLYNTTANSFFSTTMNDMRLDEPTASIVLGGRWPGLTDWRAGDTVHTNSLAGTPNPPGATLYRSSVTHFPMGYLTNEDVIAFEDLAQPAVLRAR